MTRRFLAATNKAEDPTIYPAGGTFHHHIAISLLSNDGSVVHYTVDGTEPTGSSNVVNSGELVVLEESGTLRAKAAFPDNPFNERASGEIQANFTVYSAGVDTLIVLQVSNRVLYIRQMAMVMMQSHFITPSLRFCQRTYDGGSKSCTARDIKPTTTADYMALHISSLGAPFPTLSRKVRTRVLRASFHGLGILGETSRSKPGNYGPGHRSSTRRSDRLCRLLLEWGRWSLQGTGTRM